MGRKKEAASMSRLLDKELSPQTNPTMYLIQGCTSPRSEKMTNEQKDELRRLVKQEINAGRDIQEATAKLKRLGYCASTIRRYYLVAKGLNE